MTKKSITTLRKIGMLLQALRNSEAHRIHLKAKNQVIFFEKKGQFKYFKFTTQALYRITCDVILIKEKRTTSHFFSAVTGFYGQY